MEKKKGKVNKKKWTQWWHHIFPIIGRYPMHLYSILVYHIKIDKFHEKKKRPYLILYNHQTGFDQFFVGIAFKGPVYYVATEDIFSMGFASKLIKLLVNPIPIMKQTGDLNAVRNCVKVAKEGGTIAMAPEGNRTYSGKTEYINPSVVKLCKMMKLPILLYHIEGGFGVFPRFSDKVRKGKMHSYVSEVIEPEEYLKLSDSELLERIKSGLYVNEGCDTGEYISKNPAEYVERVLYVCPTCGLSEFESKGDIFYCKKCEKKIRYTSRKKLEAVDHQIPFNYLTEWYDYQNKFISDLSYDAVTSDALYTEKAESFEVLVYKKKIKLEKEVLISLYKNQIIVKGKEEKVFSFDDLLAVTVLGKNKLNLYLKDHVYQYKGDSHFNAVKYVNMYYKYKNVQKGDEHGEFLGI